MTSSTRVTPTNSNSLTRRGRGRGRNSPHKKASPMKKLADCCKQALGAKEKAIPESVRAMCRQIVHGFHMDGEKKRETRRGSPR